MGELVQPPKLGNLRTDRLLSGTNPSLQDNRTLVHLDLLRIFGSANK
jgi:hypothetical protein